MKQAASFVRNSKDGGIVADNCDIGKAPNVIINKLLSEDIVDDMHTDTESTSNEMRKTVLTW